MQQFISDTALEIHTERHHGRIVCNSVDGRGGTGVAVVFVSGWFCALWLAVYFWMLFLKGLCCVLP